MDDALIVPTDSDRAAQLDVLVIAEDVPLRQSLETALTRGDDRLSFADVLEEGLEIAQAAVPDVVFLDVAMEDRAGVALVHHLRALAPSLEVYALVRAEDFELAAQAMSLGASGLILVPAAGDDLLSTLSAVRARRMSELDRRRWEADARAARSARALSAALATAAEAKNRRAAADALADAIQHHARARHTAVYVPAADRSRELLRLAARGLDEAPAVADEITLHGYAAAQGLDSLRLEVGGERAGHLLVGGLEVAGAIREEVLELLSAQAATALALVAAREQVQRGAMKDPGSSAYTFSYFVDVAGREIDKARRHRRRFALAIFTLDDAAGEHASVELAERVLATVRATDVLARVDEREFYLLMPETGGLGAQTTRRRLSKRLSGLPGQRQGEGAPLSVTLGTATYPHDGSDLPALLRVAKHRADAASASFVRTLDYRQPLDEVLEALFWLVAEKADTPSWLRPRSIELPIVDLAGLASACIGEASRGGPARVVATDGPGLSLGAMVRSAIGMDRSDVDLSVVDASALGAENVEALAVEAEHGCYALLGRRERNLVRAVHAGDPALVDLVLEVFFEGRRAS